MVITTLLVGLMPLQSISTVVVAVLGARHEHRAAGHAQQTAIAPVHSTVDASVDSGMVPPIVESGADSTADPMAGWKDFRRSFYDTPVSVAAPLASSEAHERMHSLGLRHHHDVDDASVIDLEGSGDDGAAGGAAPAVAGFVFVPVSAGLRVPPPPRALGFPWRLSAEVAPASQTPRRIERPPRFVG